MNSNAIATVRTLIALGLSDEQIAGLIGLGTIGATVNVPNGQTTVEAPSVERGSRNGGVTYSAVVNVDRLARIKLTPQQRRVAEYVIKHPGKTSKQIAQATGIGEKAVQSPIYQLRNTSPRVLKSSQD